MNRRIRKVAQPTKSSLFYIYFGLNPLFGMLMPTSNTRAEVSLGTIFRLLLYRKGGNSRVELGGLARCFSIDPRLLNDFPKAKEAAAIDKKFQRRLKILRLSKSSRFILIVTERLRDILRVYNDCLRLLSSAYQQQL